MKLYITRHGQVASFDSMTPEEKAEFRFGEPPLSQLGREQAALLGKRLKELGFKGKILSSPLFRTLETATIIAEITDSVIYPVAALHEIFDTEKMVEEYRGYTIEEIKERFPRVYPDSFLPEKWWYEEDGTLQVETEESMVERVKRGFAPVIKQYEDEEEILVVGHAASFAALIRMYNIKEKAKSKIVAENQYAMFNCALSVVDTENSDFVPLYCDTEHIPYEKCSANHKSREEWDKEYFEKEYKGEICIPDGFEKAEGKKILHIGDTLSKHYPYYRKLIETVKPDMILHTGDLVDEVKLGRFPERLYEYRTKVEKILKIMSESNVPLIIVPGNNDAPEIIRKFAPNAQLYERNSVVEIYGQNCRIGHEVRLMSFDCPWNFYGHGPTGDEWSLDKNIDGVNWRFNAAFDSYVHFINDRKCFCFPEPMEFE